MRIRNPNIGRMLVVLLVLTLIAAACAGDDTGETTTTAAGTETTAAATETTAAATETTAAATAEPVAVCELAYYTGEFAPYGPSLTADVVFPVEQVINLDPPLGRPWVNYNEDLGTVGEAQAARTCLEQHNAEIMVSIAHGYRTYRDFMIEWWAEHDSPLGPSVHGGAIPGNLGGKATEPIFRAQGLDEALGAFGVVYAEQIGATKIAIFATQVEGFQLASDAAEAAAAFMGLEVIGRIDVPAEQPSYRAEAQQLADLAPDAVIVEAGSVESATLIKAAAEAGLSLNWIGETGWIQPEFLDTLGTEPIATQESIGFIGFGYDDTTPAWAFYEPLWDNTPGYGDLYGPATDLYHYSTYDVMIQTALAVEYGGSYKASDWAPAMFAVGDPPGEVCYTYPDCLALIRAGEDIDYEGITGPGAYTDGGVNAVINAYFPVLPDGTFGDFVIVDPVRGLEVTDQIKKDAECDANNVCTW